ncbi:MAG TPA: Asp-tRNA(Asn)/Glu-tRNA(Gln) amidotransferase subunit GatC [Syntrophomonadaceae bacterium]|nr:Asp-tRNA(Asn)/Glu-tRNA(Gln) amidotransferase subunit GatC [Syntrophomonadaceae bacterium]
MDLTIKDIEDIALLARLNLSEQEKETLIKELGTLFNFVDKLQDLDTEGIEPLINTLSVYNVFRSDEVRQSPSREEMLSNAPLTEDGYYKVPKIM